MEIKTDEELETTQFHEGQSATARPTGSVPVTTATRPLHRHYLGFARYCRPIERFHLRKRTHDCEASEISTIPMKVIKTDDTMAIPTLYRRNLSRQNLDPAGDFNALATYW